MRVLLFQVDGKLPNLALMRLSAWHKQRGDEVTLTNSVGKYANHLQGSFNFDTPDRVYCSSIFTSSHERRRVLANAFPDAITGGDGYHPIWNDFTIIGKNVGSNLKSVIRDCDPEEIFPDYSHYPNFDGSIGYTQRGCRLDCGFCRMKTREGTPRSVRTLHELWRGAPYPKNIHLLDNDFFGQDQWRDRLEEAIHGKFKICFNQGINIRLISEEQAEVLAKVRYTDDSFTSKRLYTAWDNLGDEQRFKDGVEMLQRAGISPKHLMVYMLIGFRRGETEEEVLYRYNEMVKLGCNPYPMVFDNKNKFLKHFQRWVVRRYCKFKTWDEYKSYWNIQNEVV